VYSEYTQIFSVVNGVATARILKWGSVALRDLPRHDRGHPGNPQSSAGESPMRLFALSERASGCDNRHALAP
jgi:hypothetical protein